MFSEDKIDLAKNEKDSLKDQCDKQSESLRRQYSMMIGDNEKENRELKGKIETMEIKNVELYTYLKVNFFEFSINLWFYRTLNKKGSYQRRYQKHYQYLKEKEMNLKLLK